LKFVDINFIVGTRNGLEPCLDIAQLRNSIPARLHDRFALIHRHPDCPRFPYRYPDWNNIRFLKLKAG